MENPVITDFLRYIKQESPDLSTQEPELLLKGISVVSLKPKQFYSRANTVQDKIGFVRTGLLRAFCIDNRGNEITVNFIAENNFAVHYNL